jgi:antitoxin component YwqK of YwqJK toxin-antitoxin module
MLYFLRKIILVIGITACLNTSYAQIIYYQLVSTDPNSQDFPIYQKYIIDDNKDTIVKGFFSNDSIAYIYKLYKSRPSGRYKVYHPNGQIKYFGVFVNGSLNGIWKEFNNSKRLIVSGSYKYGKKDGVWYYFDKKQVEVYNEGKADGRWRIDEGWAPRTLFLYRKGVLIKIKRKREHNTFYN